MNQDERARLTAERDRLRDALRSIATCDEFSKTPMHWSLLRARSIARAALAESEEAT